MNNFVFNGLTTGVMSGIFGSIFFSIIVNSQINKSRDKLWIDTYGVFQKNRNTVTESITIVNGDNCSSNGPITINNGITVTINSGGNWTIV